MDLATALAAYRLVALDTSPFIYLFEKHAVFYPIVAPIFARLDGDADFRAVTSTITLVEVCTLPLKQNKPQLVQTYSNALLNSPRVSTLPVDAAIAQRAAELRAKHNLRTPDAIQIATALVARAGVFITNDVSLKRVTEIPILILSDFA